MLVGQCRHVLLALVLFMPRTRTLVTDSLGSAGPMNLILQLLPLDVRNGKEASLGTAVLTAPMVRLHMLFAPAVPLGAGSITVAESFPDVSLPKDCLVKILLFCELEPDSETMSPADNQFMPDLDGGGDPCLGKARMEFHIGCESSIADLHVTSGFWRIRADWFFQGEKVATGTRSFEVLKEEIAALSIRYREEHFNETLQCNRANIINRIMREKKFDRFLEIGVSDGTNYNRIRHARHKIGVDPVKLYMGLNYTLTSDQAFALFKQRNECFDLIFVDGLHISDQVDRDIEQSLQVLCQGGIVLLHDCNPPSSRQASRVTVDLDYDDWSKPPDGGCPWPSGFHTMQRGWEVNFECCEAVNGQWNGDVWRSLVRFRCGRSSHAYLTGVIDCDWGVGFIIPLPDQSSLLQGGDFRTAKLNPPEWCVDADPPWSFFTDNRAAMLNLVDLDGFFDEILPASGRVAAEQPQSPRAMWSRQQIRWRGGVGADQEEEEEGGSDAEGKFAVQRPREQDARAVNGASQGGKRRSILVVYAYIETERGAQNLGFFLEQTAKYDQLQTAAAIDMHYVIIISGKRCSVPLPRNDRGYQIVPIENTGTDFGAYYVVFSSCILRAEGAGSRVEFCEDLLRYDFFFFINSSARGPFLAPYLRKVMHWTAPFTSLLSETVKLVGPSLFITDSEEKAEPVLDGYMLVTDQIGLKILFDSNIFRLHADLRQCIEAEFAAARAILAGGYGVDTLASQYQGFDWQDRSRFPPSTYRDHFKIDVAQTVNQLRCAVPGVQPGVAYALHPYEVIFIKTMWGVTRTTKEEEEEEVWRQQDPVKEAIKYNFVQEEVFTRLHLDRAL